jgi:hypothetical protein
MQRILAWALLLTLGALVLRARLEHAEDIAYLAWSRQDAERAEERARRIEARLVMCEAQR